VAAASSLAHSGWRPATGELRLVLVCDEEAGARFGARWLCEEHPHKVRCDWLVNEGAGERIDVAGRSLYSICVGEKGVYRFRLRTIGRAGHASIPRIGDNALLKMAALLQRLGAQQPPFDAYPEARTCLATLTQSTVSDLGSALESVRRMDVRLAELLEPMLGVTLSPTMISASEKENVIPSRSTTLVDCRVPPGFGADHVVRRVEEILGPAGESYALEFEEDVSGSSSPLEGPLADAIRSWARADADADADLLPLVLSGFTDSRWFRAAFPECTAYGFFPQRAMTIFETTPLVHSADERIAIDDLGLASAFYRDLALRLLHP
jgi:acetylornithine deacetylase/succinyl-diaminopimelate desuccinylase-like protein